MTGPRIDYDLDERAYHADPALSSSGARAILRSPARFAYDREHGRPDTKAFDEGKAAHSLVLGTGAPLFVPVDGLGVPFTEWRTDEAKAQVEQARAAGCVPVKIEQRDRVLAMARALASHPRAGALLDPTRGRPEVSGFWTDAETGAECRVRFDLLRDDAIVDLKTTDDASPHGFARSAAKYGYHQQDAWYRDGAAALGLGDLPFVFVVVEKDPPHLVACYELDADALAAGWRRNRRALEVFARCTETGRWPGYPEHIQQLSLPRWAVTDTGEDYY